MPDQSHSVYKTLTWLLLLVVIGLYTIHLWYSGTLKGNLAAQQVKIAEGAQQFKQAKVDLDLAAQTEKTLRAEIEGLIGKVETANQAYLALQGDMEKLKKQDADVLAAEQRKAGDAYAEIKGRLDSANQTIAALRADVEGLQKVQADAAARHDAQLIAAQQQHQARVQEVEGQLNERIAALRTALEGTDPDRAALFADFDQRIQNGLVTIADLETTKADLGARLTDARQAVEQGAQALAETTTRLEAAQSELTQTRGELVQLQSQYDTAMDKATMDQAALQAKLDAAVEKAVKDRAGLQAQHAAALEEAAKQRADLEASHASAMEQAAKASADLEAQHAAALAQASKEAAAREARLEGDLAQAKAAHADELGQANSRIQTLTDDLTALRTKDEGLMADLAAETAALAALRTEDEALKAQLAAESASLTALKAQDDALMAKYNAETAAHAALRTKHDTLMAELNGKLADTEKALAGVKADLDTATKAAAEQKAALEQQISDAKGRTANLEQTLATERKQNEEARIAADQANRAALAYQHDLYARFSDIGAKETEQGMLLRIAETEVQFPVSKATLPKGDLPSLDRVARLLTDFPKLTARIEGHTDAAGRDETNLALSQARADAVKQALVDRGVTVERLEAVGLGETRPIADNATKAGSRQNRRVEVYINEGAR